MRYITFYRSGQQSFTHITTDAAVRTYCGLIIAQVHAESRFTVDRPAPGSTETICPDCLKDERHRQPSPQSPRTAAPADTATINDAGQHRQIRRARHLAQSPIPNHQP